MREVSRNARIASAALVFDPWAAIGRALLEVAAIVVMVFSVVEKLVRATHGTDAVGLTNRPVASPATEWATEIQSAATCLTGLPTAKWPATMPVATKRYRDCRTPSRRLLSIAFEPRCNSRHQLARYASRHQVDDSES